MQKFFSLNLIEFYEAFKFSAIVGLIPSFFFPYIDVWVNGNIDYIRIALGIVIVDHALGSLVHSRIYKNDWDWKKNITGFGIKISMVVAFGFIMEGLAHITIADDFIYKYIKMTGRILVCLYPGMSALRNIKIITYGRFPPDALIGKLENFNRDLDLEKLKKGNDAESN
jgi:hypothetical protein